MTEITGASRIPFGFDEELLRTQRTSRLNGNEGKRMLGMSFCLPQFVARAVLALHVVSTIAHAAEAPPPLIFAENDPEMRAAAREARRRLPEFRAFLKEKQRGVDVRIQVQRQGLDTYLVGNLVGLEGDILIVRLEYPDISDDRRVSWDAIVDWTVYHEDGTYSGGFTTKAMLRKLRQQNHPIPASLEWIETEARPDP